MAKRGAKEKYDAAYFADEDNLKQFESWGREGLIDSEIAKRLGISLATLYNYKNKYPRFAESLKNAKAEADYVVKESLYKKATGYFYDEVEEIYDESGALIKTKRTRKHIPANEKAILAWLQNREPEEWREKSDVKVEATGFTFNVKLVDDDEE
jgi:transcriptional regulator with XRE-family HTH domain